MKTVFLTLLMITTGLVAFAQTTYELQTDTVTQGKMMVGIIHKSDLIKEPEFKAWYSESQAIYPEPNAEAVKALKDHKNDIYLIVFGGTWCEDTHFVLPKFFRIQEAAGFPEDRIALFAVDRYKKMTNPLAEAMGVHNVPAIIVIKDGKEAGRVVEYGKTGYWDKELAAVVNGSDNNGK